VPSTKVKPTATIAVTPTPPCQIVPVRGFGKVWNDNPKAKEYVGCTSYSTEQGMDYVAQRFEKGVMFALSNIEGYDYFAKGYVFVLFADDGTYIKVPDTWSKDQPEPTPLAPPAGKLEPRDRLGKAWREGAGVRDRLGWAIEAESSGKGSWQEFDRGYMFWIVFNKDTPQEIKMIYVLATYSPAPSYGQRNDWLGFEDKWKE
jgi:hypothetical protein